MTEIWINHELYKIAQPSLTVIELAYLSGLSGAKPTYRKDGSVITNPDWCVVECDEVGDWIEPVWTVEKDGLHPVPLREGMCFASFPDGTY